MPTYAYSCTVCGHSFDVRQSFDDAPLTVCPECSGALRKVFSPVGVVFKGSGFYRTDARSSGGSGSDGTAKTGASGAKDAGSSGSGSSGGSGTSSATSGTGSSGSSTRTSSAPATPKAATP